MAATLTDEKRKIEVSVLPPRSGRNFVHRHLLSVPRRLIKELHAVVKYTPNLVVSSRELTFPDQRYCEAHEGSSVDAHDILFRISWGTPCAGHRIMIPPLVPRTHGDWFSIVSPLVLHAKGERYRGVLDSRFQSSLGYEVYSLHIKALFLLFWCTLSPDEQERAEADSAVRVAVRSLGAGHRSSRLRGERLSERCDIGTGQMYDPLGTVVQADLCCPRVFHV